MLNENQETYSFNNNDESVNKKTEAIDDDSTSEEQTEKNIKIL